MTRTPAKEAIFEGGPMSSESNEQVTGTEQDVLVLDRVGTDDRVARITFNRPDKLNALSMDLLEEFDRALHELERDFSVRAIIIRGAGRAFSSGYDLAPPDRGTADGVGAGHRKEDEQGRQLFMGTRTGMQDVVDIFMYFWNVAKVTIAQIHGYALAGGCELAMMADLVVAADDAAIGHPGVRFATSRTGVMWPYVLGMRKAKELYYTGEAISGEEAEKIGMINHAWPLEDLDARTIAYADHIANLPSDHLGVLKQSFNRFYENMGLYSSIRSAVDLDAVASQHTSQAIAFREKLAEGINSGAGLGPAFAWRDGPYRDHRPGRKPSS
jgi:enoyl-CoA hydratase